MLKRQSNVLDVSMSVYRFRSGEVVITPGSHDGRKADAALMLQLKSIRRRARAVRRLLLEDIMVGIKNLNYEHVMCSLLFG